MHKRYIWPSALIIVVIIISGFGFLANYSSRSPIAEKKIASPPPKTPSPTPTLDRLAIEAIRSRKYLASPLVEVQPLGEQLGYKNTIISYDSEGYKVYALMSIPNGLRPVAGWPVIILNHGYINPAHYATAGPEYRQFITSFTGAGYAVIKPDFRGHGRSQGIAEGGHFSPVYSYDVLNLISSVKQNGTQFDPNRIGLFAHSMGGHVALRTIVASPDVKATVFMAAVVGSFDDIFYSWPHSPLGLDMPTQVHAIRQKAIDTFGSPKENPGFWNSASAINYVTSVTGPVQINQDAGDLTVPTVFSDHLDAALKAAGRRVEYHLYPGNDHQFIKNRTLLLQRTLAFYKANL